MSFDEAAIRVSKLGKCYRIYDRPQDRLKHALIPRLERVLGRAGRQYGREFWAVNDVSFDVVKGEVLGIVGRNGSGKSTLLQIICGTLSPTTGSVEVYGRVGALLELGAGFNPEFSGRENVYLNGMLLGLSRQEMDERMGDILAFADIGEFIDQPVKMYSSGMFARLAFSVQASLEPEILIVDEALAVGDSQFVHKCMHRFHQMREQGRTILLVTHDATAVKTLCDRAVWIDKGCVQGIGEASAIVDQYLAAISGQRAYPKNASDKPADKRIQVNDAVPNVETAIPNMDQRFGDQTCEIVGLGLYDTSLQRRSAINNRSDVIVRITVANHKLEPGTPLLVGIVLRNSRGVDIASANSEMEGAQLLAPPIGSTTNIRMKLYLPEVHPGSYSFRVAVSRRTENGELLGSDDLVNGLVFDVLSARPVYVLMLLDAQFSAES